jgi:hypothetical protein
MAWEQRGNRRYYYRKRREGKRVISEYQGTGDLAELTAKIDQIEQEQEQERRQAWAAKKAEVEAVDAVLADYNNLVQAMTDATLLLAGYRKHKRQWRKIRNVRKQSD